MGKLVKEIMSDKPVLISKDASILEAAKKMAEADVGVLPVWDDKLGAIVGMITDRDIVVRGLPAKQTLDFKVNEVMSHGVHHINEDAEVTAAAQYMGEKQLRRLMVTNREKKFVGILSLGDIRTPGFGFNVEELSMIVFEVSKGRQARRRLQKERMGGLKGVEEQTQPLQQQPSAGEEEEEGSELFRSFMQSQKQFGKGQKQYQPEGLGQQYGQGEQLQGQQYQETKQGEQLPGQELYQAFQQQSLGQEKGQYQQGEQFQGQYQKGGLGQEFKGEQLPKESTILGKEGQKQQQQPSLQTSQ
jgi:CBS domain-containing protein